MPNFQLFIPADAPRGGSIASEDFGAAADELLSKALEGDAVSDELGEQATAAVNAAKQLVASGHAGSERVVCVISSRVNPDAVPAGTGHIVSIELSSRPSPQVEAEAPAEGEQAAQPDDAAEVAATKAAMDHAFLMGIDIATIQGTGKDGKVTKADVEAAVEAAEAGKASDQPTS